MKLIGISGKARSGKTTLADMLEHTAPFHRQVSLASALKLKCRKDFGLSVEQTDGKLKEVVDPRYGKSPRQIMIDTGKFYRSIDPDYWVKQLETGLWQDKINVVSDIRFKNEAEFIKKHDGLLIRLDRAESLTGPYIDDISETGLDNYDGFDMRFPPECNWDMNDLRKIANRLWVWEEDHGWLSTVCA